jgi:hypothetical protein
MSGNPDMHLLVTDTLNKWASGSHYGISGNSNCYQLNVIMYVVHSSCLTIPPPPPRGTLFTTLTSANCLPTRRHTHGLRLWDRLDVLTNSLKWCWRWLLVENIKFSGNSSDGHSCSQHANCLCRIVLWDKTAQFIGAFYCPSTRCTCVKLMLFNQLCDMPHQLGGWIILAKDEFS